MGVLLRGPVGKPVDKAMQMMASGSDGIQSRAAIC
jgi:hypothetical protein